MDNSQEKSIVDQLLGAVDEEDCATARYKLCKALEAANDDAPVQIETAREPVSDHKK